MKNHQAQLAGLGISPPLVPSHNQNYLRKRETRTVHFWPTPGNCDPYMCRAVWYPFAICGFLHFNEWKWNKMINSVPQLHQPHFTWSATTLGGAAKLPEGGTCFTDQIHVCQQVSAEGINSLLANETVKGWLTIKHPVRFLQPREGLGGLAMVALPPYDCSPLPSLITNETTVLISSI